MNNKEARSIQMSSRNVHVIIDKHKMMKTKRNIFNCSIYMMRLVRIDIAAKKEKVMITSNKCAKKK